MGHRWEMCPKMVPNYHPQLEGKKRRKSCHSFPSKFDNGKLAKERKPNHIGFHSKSYWIHIYIIYLLFIHSFIYNPTILKKIISS